MASYNLSRQIAAPGWTRRAVLRLGVLAVGGWAAGCATNPVTRRRQFILLTTDDEIRLDRQFSPHQISADFGAVQGRELNAYVEQIGLGLARVSHRPNMPYSFRVVNASYCNAYAFPGGTIAVTRGMLLALEDEAQLAALLGHEIGHVCARHAAEQMSKNVVAGLLVAGVVAAARRRGEAYEDWALGLGAIGAGMLLAKYSRDDEREADELGMQYAVRAGYPADGMVGLMDILRRLSRHRPNAIERMFASHPMSEERYQTASHRARQQEFAAAADAPRYRERFLDATARLRTLKAAVEEIQKGDEAMGRGQAAVAADRYRAALAQAPDDYEALLKQSACARWLRRPDQALEYAEAARAVYPEEPQAWFSVGVARLLLHRFELALQDFEAYERRLPGNPQTVFYRGRCYEGLGQRESAIAFYRRYLESGVEGEEADYARRRLQEWGVLPS